ncbi:MAG TPA: serine/threonine-protein kinase, partial [Planctomycetota bacterium]|nr:serine/threonine-protein kinase [Planctomycetota bacterium]
MDDSSWRGSARGAVRIGPYEVVGELGRGGASVVFRALGPDGRVVALKLVRHESADAAARFAREVRVQAALGEVDGFVPLLASGESPHGSYIVMPFMAGGTLRQRLRGRALDPTQAMALLSTLAATVGRAHAKGIVHRDLKPENVLFTADDRPLIADLGLAKRFEGKGSQSIALSRTTDGRGTIGYMAPE